MKRPLPSTVASSAVAAADADRLTLRVHRSIAEIDERAWDSLSPEDATPFTRHAFLEALEHTGCAVPRRGWQPLHLALYAGDVDERGGRVERLVAAAPCYALQQSDGDFSQDWGFADGALRAGIAYYPKLAITVPFTPATGRRFLVVPGFDAEVATTRLYEAARSLAEEIGASGVQVLFPLAEEAARLESLGAIRRLSFQYHFKNVGYASYDEFLARFDSKRRNQLKRERAAAGKQGIAIRTVRGDELRADPTGWARAVHGLHRSTVEKLAWGRGWLNGAFYERIFSRMPEPLEVVEARRDGKLVAGAFNVASKTRLYGRYWGCVEDHPFLHFNVCFYHSIAECIARGLRVFEGGAGGEHKVTRGFEPSFTYGAHAYLDPRLDEAVRRHVQRENRSLEAGLADWQARSPVLKAMRPSDETTDEAPGEASENGIADDDEAGSR